MHTCMQLTPSIGGSRQRSTHMQLSLSHVSFIHCIFMHTQQLLPFPCSLFSTEMQTSSSSSLSHAKHSKQELQSQHHVPLLHLPLFFYSYRKPASQGPSPLSDFFHEKTGKQAAAVQSTIRSTPASLARAEQRDAGGHGPDK